MRTITLRTITLGTVLSIIGVFAAGALEAQTPPADVAKTANPELVGMLTTEVGVTAAQAEGGAGALLGLAKSRLSADEFTKVSTAIPGTDALLKAAPAAAAGAGGALGSVAGASGGLASLAGSFSKLGLTPDSAAKFAPVLMKYVNAKGATEAASLLGRVLK
jgi:Protein of unknown function VcgC/VcgE (DUF2780)